MSANELNQSEMNGRVATEGAASAPLAGAAVRVVVPEGFTVMRLGAAAAAGIAEGALPRILTQRAAVAAEFGEERAAYIDALPRLVNETQDAYLGVTMVEAGGSVATLHAEVSACHALLISDADGLVRRRLLDPNLVEPCRPAQGYLTTVSSTLLTVKLFREQWEQIKERAPTSKEDLDVAESKALELRQRLHEGELGAERIMAMERRTQLLTMLVRQYGEVRRMIGFVRYWNDDADTIAPSLWSGRRGKKRALGANDGADDGEERDQPTPLPTQSGPVNGGGTFIS